ncbi:MAG: T9SS type A sorting domain-containing protein [Saprospiraceae bacterium]
MLRKLFIYLLAANAFSALYSQIGCPGCQVVLPDLPVDTIFLSNAPEGEAGIYYDEDLSFRLPLTTTPVNAADPTIPAGLPINEFNILGVSGLPAGLTWEANQLNFLTEELTDGCVKLCGTPLIPGLYMVDVVIEARIVFITQQTAFSFPLLITPAQSVTEGFTIVNNSGCGEVTAELINNVPSNGATGFSYMWLFSNGGVSTEENPAPQLFNTVGEHFISYQAIIDTVGFILTNVRIEESPCTDLLSRADLKFDLFDPNGDHVFTAPIVENAMLPISWDVVLPIGEGVYELHVIDDDGGIDGADDLCGIIPITQATNGLQVDGELSVAISMIHPVDTILSLDVVTVYPIPASPVLAVQEEMPWCEGTPVHISALNYPEGGLVWHQDSIPLPGQSQGVLATLEDGAYYVTYTSPAGCLSSSNEVAVEFTANPAPFALEQNGNLIRLVDESNLPEDFSFMWLYEGENVPEANMLRICAQATGEYTLLITDNLTGCSNSASLVASYDPAIDCTTPVDDFTAETHWLVYPNPFGEWVRFSSAAETAIVYVSLWNMLGQPVSTTQITAGEATWSLEDLPIGVYRYKIFRSNGTIIQTGSLVKQ